MDHSYVCLACLEEKTFEHDPKILVIKDNDDKVVGIVCRGCAGKTTTNIVHAESFSLMQYVSEDAGIYASVRL